MEAAIIADNVTRLRGRKAWTQAHLAEAADVTERTVQRAEAGTRIGAESLQAIAGALDVSVDELRKHPASEVSAPRSQACLVPTLVVRGAQVEPGGTLRYELVHSPPEVVRRLCHYRASLFEAEGRRHYDHALLGSVYAEEHRENSRRAVAGYERHLYDYARERQERGLLIPLTIYVRNAGEQVVRGVRVSIRVDTPLGLVATPGAPDYPEGLEALLLPNPLATRGGYIDPCHLEREGLTGPRLDTGVATFKAESIGLRLLAPLEGLSLGVPRSLGVGTGMLTVTVQSDELPPQPYTFEFRLEPVTVEAFLHAPT